MEAPRLRRALVTLGTFLVESYRGSPLLVLFPHPRVAPPIPARSDSPADRPGRWR